MALANYVFFLNKSGELNEECNVPNNAETMVLQVKGTDVNLAVKGKITNSKNELEMVEEVLATISATDFSAGQTITKAGIYSVSTVGINSLIISGTGTEVTVIGELN